jgi:methylenetetrahydrofolate--tRNA-(uracil-5-)-methyltransferase
MSIIVSVIGGGLAGSEASLQLARHGIRVNLYEMRPLRMTPAHRSSDLGELVCSNSFKSVETKRAGGLLKQEISLLGSELLRIAEENALPGGKALVVDREGFQRAVTKCIEDNPLIEIKREEITDRSLEDETPVIYATGPLTSDALLASFEKDFCSSLSFYDAIAPSVLTESLDMCRFFWGSRNEPDSNDYLNLPLSREEYLSFYQSLLDADTIATRPFEKNYFEVCLPIEELARRGVDTLRFGPLKPIGFDTPVDLPKPYAIIQLRREDKEGRIMGLVGCQTRLSYTAQRDVIKRLPGFSSVEFARLGSIHKNSYLDSPKFLNKYLQMKDGRRVWFCGQIAGSEGYTEAIATGLWAGLNATFILNDQEIDTLPRESVIGSLIAYLSEGESPIKPMQSNWGLLDTKGIKKGKDRYKGLQEKSIRSIEAFTRKFL